MIGTEIRNRYSFKVRKVAARILRKRPPSPGQSAHSKIPEHPLFTIEMLFNFDQTYEVPKSDNPLFEKLRG